MAVVEDPDYCDVLDRIARIRAIRDAIRGK
jgi:hypothetical protein